MGPSVLTKGVQGVQYSGFSSARGRRSRYSGFSSVRARVNVPFMRRLKEKSVRIACLASIALSFIHVVVKEDSKALTYVTPGNRKGNTITM